MIETKDRILDSAERLFADGGYAATSLRSIMAEAGVNVAAVHYYFRSKESLLEAVLMRRVEPANEERMHALETYEQNTVGRRLTRWRCILEAFLYPTFRMAADPEQGGYTFVRLPGPPASRKRLAAEAGSRAVRPGAAGAACSADALARALRSDCCRAQGELFWRARLAMGATSQILRDAPADPKPDDGRCAGLEGDDGAADSFLKRWIPFAA